MKKRDSSWRRYTLAYSTLHTDPYLIILSLLNSRVKLGANLLSNGALGHPQVIASVTVLGHKAQKSVIWDIDQLYANVINFQCVRDGHGWARKNFFFTKTPFPPKPKADREILIHTGRTPADQCASQRAHSCCGWRGTDPQASYQWRCQCRQGAPWRDRACQSMWNIHTVIRESEKLTLFIIISLEKKSLITNTCFSNQHQKTNNNCFSSSIGGLSMS